MNSEKTILFTGDSITDCHRSHPIGKGSGLGDGYVNLLNSQFQQNYPESNFKILNTGVSGDTILDLERRWKRDILDLQPDWVSIMIGINDVWQQVEVPYLFTDLNKASYERLYIELIESIIDKTKKIILMTPYYIELDSNDTMRARMDEYGDVVQKISNQFGTVFVDTQKGFDRYLQNESPFSISDDQVHPNLIGHKIIANCWLDALGFKELV